MRSHPSRGSYRPDIDGLRAIAVLAVIAFHLNSAVFPGGFVGVDIFFVISGYLISLHIFGALNQDHFSLAEFYRRRIKRIAPALLLVLAVTFALSQLLLRPQDAEDVGRASLWSLLSMANVYFWLHQDAGYFAQSTSELPLLHLWSLGIEEQFYVLWPPLLMALYTRRRPILFSVGLFAIAAMSFAFGQYYYHVDASFVYYMLPSRAGELLVGAGLAYATINLAAPRVSSYLSHAAAGVGVALLAVSIFGFSEEQIFPGFRGTVPALGTALLIFAGSTTENGISSLLRTAPMVGIGLVSYSAYLWHWPILAVLRYSDVAINLPSGSAVLVATFVLAWLTYRFVETPCRKSSQPLIRVAFRQYAVPATAIGVAALVAMKTDGYTLHWLLPNYRNDLSAVVNATKPAYEFNQVCQVERVEIVDMQKRQCILGRGEGSQVRTLLWGDSNAAHYVGMLGIFADAASFRFRNIEVGVCPPLVGDPAQFVALKRLEDCRVSLNTVWSAMGDYDVVIIAASWTAYQYRSALFFDQFVKTIERLRQENKRIIIMGKAPVIYGFDRYCQEKAVAIPWMKCAYEDVALDATVAEFNRRLLTLANGDKDIDYFDANEYLCPNGRCAVRAKDGALRYFDAGHLTFGASEQLGRDIVQLEGVPAQFASLH